MASSRNAFSHRTQQILDKLKVSSNSDDGGESGQFGKWSNKDLDPSPPSQRIWSAWSFFAFQFSIAFSPTTYNAGASLYAIGLNWWTIFIASSMLPPFSVAVLGSGLTLWLVVRSYCVDYDCYSAIPECQRTCEISHRISNFCSSIVRNLWLSRIHLHPWCKPYFICLYYSLGMNTKIPRSSQSCT